MGVEQVKDRIRKLLAVAANDASTEGEIANALSCAATLMEKHQLSQEDLDQGLDPIAAALDAEQGRTFAYIGGRCHGWEASLANWASKFVGVNCYLDHAKSTARKPNGLVMRNRLGKPFTGRRFAFYGPTEEAYIAAELFTEMRLTILSMAYLKFGGAFRGDGGAYCEGFASGLNSKLDNHRKITRSSSSTALIEKRGELMEVRDRVGRNWLAKTHGVKLNRGPARQGASGSGDAYREGKEDGRKADPKAATRPKIGG